MFLVARPEMGDPTFSHSVVLLFPASIEASDGSERIIVGLIVNRTARVHLSEIFPDEKTLKDRTETAYFGGPVAVHAYCALFRSPKEFKQAVHLFADVYVSFDADFIKEHLKTAGETSDLRLFLGRSQWAPEQLHNEMDLGAWYSVSAETNLIFSSNPEYLWNSLMERAAPGPVAKALPAPGTATQLAAAARKS